MDDFGQLLQGLTMAQHDIYIHGNPYGQQVWGRGNASDYIKTFYGRKAVAGASPALLIEVLDGCSFYTYIRRHNLSDSGGRPDAFFGLTVSFTGQYCTNVYTLYTLFESVYKKICIGNFIAQSGNREQYKVSDFKEALTDKGPAVDVIEAIFARNLNELIAPSLEKLNFGNTLNLPVMTFSLLDVDSPLFFDCMKNHSIIVAPNMPSKTIGYDDLNKRLKQSDSKRQELEQANSQLESEVTKLRKQNQNTADKAEAAAAAAAKKSKSTINELQTKLNEVTQERDDVKQRHASLSSTVEKIVPYLQDLTRHEAGRFPETTQKGIQANPQTPPKANETDILKTWLPWVNTVLLVLVGILCAAVLVFVLKHPGNPQHAFDLDPKTEATTDLSASGNDYTPWENCVINIRNGGDILKING